MSERSIVRVKFTLADSQVRRAVGGFLRYVQHRDLHPDSKADPRVGGLIKYVAYRDKAPGRAELFGSHGAQGTQGRKAFVNFVDRSIANSRPQVFRSREGQLIDRRRAVFRLIVSPERSQGLDLECLTRVAMAALAADSATDLRWIAAIHRNTAHHHVHLVVAGMHEDRAGIYRRVDITKQRLAAMKHAVGLEIERQRAERTPIRAIRLIAGTPADPGVFQRPPIDALVPPSYQQRGRVPRRAVRVPQLDWRPASLLRLRAVARHYQHQVERDAEEEARRRNWERAA